jgi:glycerol-3-phosphate dehydrogenase
VSRFLSSVIVIGVKENERIGKADVLIVGAGVIGCAVARELSRRALSVTVLEKACDVAEGATKANSAIVHAGFDAKPGTFKARFNVLGNALFEPWCRELGAPFRRNTSLVVAFTPEEQGKLEELKARGETNGVPGLRLLGGAEARALEPNLSPDVRAALLAPTGGICCPYELTLRLAEDAAANGAAFRFGCEVTRVAPCPEVAGRRGWRVETADGGTFEARAVVNAAGLHADALNNQVSAKRLTITPRRGEYLMIDKLYAGAFRATVFQTPTPMGKGVLVAPTVDGTLIVGPTAELIADKDDTRTTAAGLEKVRQSVVRVWPGFPSGGVIAAFAGLRAHGDRGDFVLGEPEDAPGFFNAAAIESPGLTAAPALAQWLAERIASHFGFSISDFGLNISNQKSKIKNPKSRKPFREMSDDERAAAVAEDPACGRIVCRCETVTEAEIRAAIRSRVGARTLDGVKRRTRAGMGRCQGGFCTPRIVEILCEELGLAPEQVTKSGGDSYLLTPRPEAGPTVRESGVAGRESFHAP